MAKGATAKRRAQIANARVKEAEWMDKLDKAEAAALSSIGGSNLKRVKAEADVAAAREQLAALRKVIRPRKKG